MKKKIFKYQINIYDETLFFAPSDFELFHIGEQNGVIVAWGTVEVDDVGSAVHNNKEIRLCIRGTGHLFRGNEGKHIKTVQMPDGLVWHIFWRL